MESAPDDVDAAMAAIRASLVRHLSRKPLGAWARLTTVFLKRFAAARKWWALLTIGLLERDAYELQPGRVWQ